MRWLVFVILFIVFSVSSFASPIDVEFEKDYLNGESVQGKLYVGESVQDQIKTNDFRLELEGVPTLIFPTLIEFEGYTYFFFNLPPSIFGNYSFVIEDVIYLKNNILTEEDLFFDFIIQESNKSIVNINPGVITLNLAESNYFYLDVSNPLDSQASVRIVMEDNFITPSQEDFLLNSGEGKTVEFYVSSVLADKNETNFLVEYGNLSYIISVFLDGINIQEQNNETNETNAGELNILEEVLDIEIDYGDSSEGFIRVSNEFNEIVEGVTIEISETLEGILELEFYEIDSLNIGEVRKNRIYVNELKDLEEGEYVGDIIVLYNDDAYDSISVHVNVLGIDGPGINVTPPNPPNGGEERDSRWTIILFIVLFLLIVGGFILIKYIKSKRKEVNSSPWFR